MRVRHFQHFSEFIKAIRRERGVSQRAMAKALRVSPGYVGQWELRLSQPSPEVAAKLCRVFGIEDMEYVQRLAFAQRAPAWLRQSILNDPHQAGPGALTSPERRLLDTFRQLPAEAQARLVERVAGWVEAMLEKL